MSDLFFDQHEDDAGPPPETYVEEAPRRRTRGWLLAFGVIAVVGLVVLGAAALWVQGKIDPSGPPGEEVALVIPVGSSTAAIAELLEAEGIISDARVFRYWVRVKGDGPWQAGEYTLRRNSSFGDAAAVLNRGPQERYTRVTVREGLTLDEIPADVGRNEQFSADRFRELLEAGPVRSAYQPDGVSLEGLLFPETYTVTERETEEDLLRRMVETFDQEAAALGYDEAQAKVGVSPYEAIIVASLVEAEAKVDEDRGKIARVIYNRIEMGERLGIDATVYYALGRRGGSLTRSDLEVDSPYNTRRYAGLPPTPIGIPGRASLAAAIDPEPGPWVFYVLADESGVHAFSETAEQFARDKREAQRKGLIP